MLFFTFPVNQIRIHSYQRILKKIVDGRLRMTFLLNICEWAFTEPTKFLTCCKSSLIRMLVHQYKQSKSEKATSYNDLLKTF